MKKLILAPAVALAFTGLVAAPVAAAETPSAQSAEAKAAEKAEKEKAEQDKAEKEELAKKEAAKKAADKKKADEKAAAEKKAAEKKAADKKAAEKKAADKKAAKDKAADEKAAKGEAAKEKTANDATAKDEAPEPAKAAPSPEPDAGTGEEEGPDTEPQAEPIDATVVVPEGEVAAEDLADPSKGVTVTVNGTEAGDLLSAVGSLSAENVTATGTSTKVRLYYSGNAEDLEDGPRSFTIDIQRTGAPVASVSGSINVAAAEDEAEPELSVDPEEITAEDLANKDKGVDVTVTNLKAGDTVEDSLTGEVESVAEDGPFTFKVFYPGDPDDLEPGKVPFTVTITRAEAPEVVLQGEITIVDEDAVDPIEASLTVDPKEITAEDLANKDKGVDVTVSGVKAGDKITDSLTGATQTADKDGDYVLRVYYDGDPDNLEPGTFPFTVTIEREGTDSATLDGEITIIADDETEAPVEASLKVSPKSIEAADFINEKKGVTLSVKDCEPGSDVRFMVTPKGNSNVTAYDNTVTADDEGRASVKVFGTSSDASAYVGAYDVTATCGDDTMEGSFKVTAGSNAGGGDNGNGGSGSGGSELPRTGAGLDGLAAGALLLLVGGAAVTITMRRRKGDFSPSYV